MIFLFNGCDTFKNERPILSPDKLTYRFQGGKSYTFNEDMVLHLSDTTRVYKLFDSTRYTYKDTIRIRDSVAIQHVIVTLYDSSAIKHMGEFFKMVRDYKP